jgi:hypothetical protein
MAPGRQADHADDLTEPGGLLQRPDDWFQDQASAYCHPGCVYRGGDAQPPSSLRQRPFNDSREFLADTVADIRQVRLRKRLAGDPYLTAGSGNHGIPVLSDEVVSGRPREAFPEIRVLLGPPRDSLRVAVTDGLWNEIALRRVHPA